MPVVSSVSGVAVPSGRAPTAEPNSATGSGPRSSAGLRHPHIVGLLAALSAAAVFVSYGSSAEAVVVAGFAAVLVVLAGFDIEQGRIPNRIVLPATGVVIVAHVAVLPDRLATFALAAVGAAVVFLIPHLIDGRMIGMGDVKLALLMGAGLGWAVLGAVMVAFLAVFPFALVSLVRNGVRSRGSTLPFGPFLAFGGLIILIVPTLIGAGVS